MNEEFDAWNSKKKFLDTHFRNLFFKEGEVWWCSIGRNIGEEVYGKGADFRRPVLLLKKLSRNSCIAVPVTMMPRDGSWYQHFRVGEKDRWVMLHQLRFISANRLSKRHSVISPRDFMQIKKSIALLLGL